LAAQVSRIFFIDNRIRRFGKVTLKEIKQQCEVSTITAKRDIETLKYTIDAPIYYDKKLRAYTYQKEFKLLNFAGEQLLIFYILARGLAQNANYLPLTAEYTREIITQKIKEILPFEYQSISDNFIYTDSDYEEIDFTIISTIIDSFINKQKCQLTYLTKGNSLSDRTIEPLKVICYGTKWYLVAFCHLKGEERFFSFSRIEKLTLLDEKIDKNNNKTDINKLINESFGIAKSKDLELATVKFYEPSSFYLKKQIWHSQQTIKEYKQDNQYILELTLPFSKPEELIGKVLKYGVTAEIIIPTSLRNLWLNEIRMMWEKFIKK